MQFLEYVYLSPFNDFSLIMGGGNRNTEAQKLAKGQNIVVATPGRLLDHLLHTEFEYKNLVCLVIDEADKILADGMEKDMKRILTLLPKKRQTMLFSATKDSGIDEIAKLGKFL